MGAPVADREKQIAARWAALDGRLTKLESIVALRLAGASSASHEVSTAGPGSAGDAPPSQGDPGLDAEILGSRQDASAGPLQVSRWLWVWALGLCIGHSIYSCRALFWLGIDLYVDPFAGEASRGAREPRRNPVLARPRAAELLRGA